jgi:predicted DNA-binding transcriptional regulator AlpA
MDIQDKLLDTKALAEYLQVATSTLRQYRLDGKGPAYIKIGHLVRYRKSDIEEWLISQEH